MINNESVILNGIHIVLNNIRENGPISKQEIKKNTGLAWATVSTAVNELVKKGYVVSCCKQKSQGAGRKADEYDITPHDNYFIGIDFSYNRIQYVVVDLKGRVVKGTEVEISVRERDSVLEQLFSDIDGFFDEFHDKKIMGIGMAVQGVVDVKEGVSVYIAKIKDWNQIPLKQLLEERYGVETLVLHDPDCLIKSEMFLGGLKGKNVTDAILIRINFRAGIGMAVMINGQVHHGVHGKAGEIGYTIIKNTPDTDRFLEEHVLREALIKEYSSRKPDDEKISYPEFVSRLENKDEICREIYEDLSKKIGFAIASGCTFYDPESLIIHTSSCPCPELLYELVVNFVKENVYDKTIMITHSDLREDAIAVGGALEVIENVLRGL